MAAIDPENTWLSYACWLELAEDDRIARHKPLGGTATVETIDDETDVADEPQGQTVGVRSLTPDLTQRLSTPMYTVRLVGAAKRLGYQIPLPRLESVGGVPAIQGRQRSRQRTIGNVGGIPVFSAQWDIEYFLTDDPQGNLPVPANPALLLGEDGQA